MVIYRILPNKGVGRISKESELSVQCAVKKGEGEEAAVEGRCDGAIAT